MTITSQHDPHLRLRRSSGAAAEQTLAEARSLDRPRRSSRAVGGSAADQGGAHDSAEAGGVDGGGVTIVVDGESVFVGANAFTDAVDEVQYDVGEGPCLSAVAARRVVTSTRIATTERRWHRFTPEAAALDLRSVRSAPITSGEHAVGLLMDRYLMTANQARTLLTPARPSRRHHRRRSSAHPDGPACRRRPRSRQPGSRPAEHPRRQAMTTEATPGGN